MKCLLIVLCVVVLQSLAHHLNDDFENYSHNSPYQTNKLPHHVQQPDSVQVVDYHQGCPNDLQPICATNGEDYLNFKNKCFLDHHNYMALIRGQEEYHECPLHLCFPHCKPCPNVVDPVCALDVKTQQLKDFKSNCEMHLASCSLRKDFRLHRRGKCQPNLHCPRLCEKFYKPVCVAFKKEVRQFPNPCELQRSRCESKIDWTILYEGLCHADSNNRFVPTFNQNYAPATYEIIPSIQTNYVASPKRPQYPVADVPRVIEYYDVPKERDNDVKHNRGTSRSYVPPQRHYPISHKDQWSAQPYPPAGVHTPPVYHNTSSHQPNSLTKSACRADVYQPVCGQLNSGVRKYPSLCHLQEEAKRLGEAWSVLPLWLCGILNTINPFLSDNNRISKPLPTTNFEKNQYVVGHNSGTRLVNRMETNHRSNAELTPGIQKFVKSTRAKGLIFPDSNASDNSHSANSLIDPRKKRNERIDQN
ncbi:uncharacterized protein [Musca autumnalis]|uniref:uncharacterized protein n=1 Tax=Musca autumnalis TaxID=221902 RepID=UPI003CE99B8C